MGAFTDNTITVARDLAAQVNKRLMNGRQIHTGGKGDWVEVDGKRYAHYVYAAGGGQEPFTKVFKSRAEQCDYLRSLLK